MTPRDAVSLSSKLIRDHFSIFVSLDEAVEQAIDGAGDSPVVANNEHLDKSVEELELSVRSYNCLKNANIRTIGDLTKKSEDEIAKTRNFGKKSLQEIKEKLKEWNLSLGMTDYSILKTAIKVPEHKEEENEA